MIQSVMLVALGGAIGSALRFLAVQGVLRVFGPGFPWGVMAVNVAGSFAMGCLAVVLMQAGPNRLSVFLLTGVLGGFTTFSAFSLDTAVLWQRGEPLQALAYVAGSVALSLVGLALGLVAGRALA
jgi:CrcB protein